MKGRISGDVYGDIFRDMLRSDASVFLHMLLPEELREALSGDPPELIERSYIRPEFGDHYSDALVRVWLKTGDEVLVYIFFLRKPDEQAPVHLERCVTEIVNERHREDPHAPPPILHPQILYYGNEKWAGPGDRGRRLRRGAFPVPGRH